MNDIDRPSQAPGHHPTDHSGPAASASELRGSPGRGGPEGAFRPGDDNGEQPQDGGGVWGVWSSPPRKTQRLREMVAADMPAVMALELALFPDDAWTPEMFATEFAEAPGRRLYLVAETCGGAEPLIGYAGMLFTGGPEADVLTLAVHPGHWGNGTGTALLRALLDEATRRHCAEVFLEVRKDNPRARGLYLRHGFVEVGVRRGYYQPAGVDAIVMRKDLGRADNRREQDR